MEIKTNDVVTLTLTLNEDEIENLMQVVWFALDYQSNQKAKGITEMTRTEEEFAKCLHKITYDITFRDSLVKDKKHASHKRVDYDFNSSYPDTLLQRYDKYRKAFLNSIYGQTAKVKKGE